MIQPNIAFAPAAAATENSTPRVSQNTSSYNDLLLKPEFATRRYKFAYGTTWLRIVPALAGSTKGWMLGIHALTHQGDSGRHAHPRSIRPGGRSAYDTTYAWFKANRPKQLRSITNKAGHRLRPDPVCLFWALFYEDGRTVARLVMASGHDGSRGGAPGLGHQIWQLTKERDEDGNLVANPIDPDTGVQISVTKSKPQGSQDPSYAVRLGSMAAPIDGFLHYMEAGEIEALRPLEEVVHVPNVDEEWQILEGMIGADLVAQIRAEEIQLENGPGSAGVCLSPTPLRKALPCPDGEGVNPLKHTTIKRITAEEFKHAVQLDPAWAAKLTEPVEVTGYCDMSGSGISHLSPLLTFRGRNERGDVANLSGCMALRVAEGCFNGLVDFTESGIERIGDLSITRPNEDGEAAYFTLCIALKVAAGRFPGFVSFDASGIKGIGDLNIAAPNSYGTWASFLVCSSLEFKRIGDAQLQHAVDLDFIGIAEKAEEILQARAAARKTAREALRDPGIEL